MTWGFLVQLSTIRLRRLPVQRVDFRDSDVAQRQRRIVWSETGPRGENGGSLEPQFLEAHEPLQLEVADTQPVEGRLVSSRAVEIEVFSIPRPIHITHWHFDPV